MLSFDSVEHVSILDPLDVGARIEDLRLLKDGWFEGRGRGLDCDGLNWLSQAFDRHYPDELPYPYLYPTPEGGLRAEWSIEPHEISLEIDLSSHSGVWHCLNMENDEPNERVLNLDKDDDWQWLSQQLQQMAGVAA